MPSNNNNTFNKIFFDTLGCAKNLVDTNKMEESLTFAGYELVEEPMKSDVIVLNTCAFIEASAQESIDTFFEYRNYYKNKKIIVAGCLPSRYKEELKESLIEADAFVPCNEEDKIVDVIKSIGFSNPLNKKTTTIKKNSYTSYIKISEGCNRFCSYCTIPYIRGKYTSYSYDTISKDVSVAIKNGAQEIVLVAQDCGAWGHDFENKKDLSWLLNNLSKDYKTAIFRILYVQPEMVTSKLIETIKTNDNIINYLDIPMQHCDKSILKSMNRNGDKVNFLKLIEKVRCEIPQCCLRTTFIVGYPGEDDISFNDLCEFVQKAKFDYAGIFEYSREEGTKAYNLKNQIDNQIKYERANKLRDICDNISLNKLNSKIGLIFDVLIEGFEDDRYYGRTYFQAPEVDGVVYIGEFSDNKNVKIGQNVKVEIVGQEAYDLVGKII